MKVYKTKSVKGSRVIANLFLPDAGYAFVFLKDGRQLFTNDNKAVQVPIAYANA